jgi:SAM-dependent methyltransferase
MPVQQTWDPAQYARHAPFVPELGAGVLELLAPRPGELILDLGCGDGELTQRLAALGAEVVGIDGNALPFENEFDAVFSNAAMHWMKRPDAVIAGVHKALRPGGRFVAELGGAGCVAAIREAITVALARRGVNAADYDPWYFPDAESYSAKLRAAGFEVRAIKLFPRPTPLATDIDGWLATFAQSFFAAVPAEERATLLAEVRGLLAPRLCDANGQWVADYVRLRFHAEKR